MKWRGGGQWLLLEHVKRGCGHPPRVEGSGKCLLVDEATASYVYEAESGSHSFEYGGVDEVVVIRSLGTAQDNEVHRFEPFWPDRMMYRLETGDGFEARIINQDVHSRRKKATCGGPADVSKADQSRCLSR
jgi:hypothetical protein